MAIIITKTKERWTNWLPISYMPCDWSPCARLNIPSLGLGCVKLWPLMLIALVTYAYFTLFAASLHMIEPAKKFSTEIYIQLKVVRRFLHKFSFCGYTLLWQSSYRQQHDCTCMVVMAHLFFFRHGSLEADVASQIAISHRCPQHDCRLLSQRKSGEQ